MNGGLEQESPVLDGQIFIVVRDLLQVGGYEFFTRDRGERVENGFAGDAGSVDLAIDHILAGFLKIGHGGPLGFCSKFNLLVQYSGPPDQPFLTFSIKPYAVIDTGRAYL